MSTSLALPKSSKEKEGYLDPRRETQLVVKITTLYMIPVANYHTKETRIGKFY